MGINNTFVGRPSHEREDTSLKRLRVRALVSSRCKYRAASRIVVLSKFSFYAAVLFSLGLIFIPLYEQTHPCGPFSIGMLNMVEIFLASAVLVFSSVTGVAQFELRSFLLNKCGRELKNVAVQVDNRIGVDETMQTYDRFLTEYTKIVEGAENHTEADYRMALLSMPDYYEISKSRRLIYWFVTIILLVIPYLVPLCFIGLEMLFIFDALHLTTVLEILHDAKNCE